MLFVLTSCVTVRSLNKKEIICIERWRVNSMKAGVPKIKVLTFNESKIIDSWREEGLPPAPSRNETWEPVKEK